MADSFLRSDLRIDRVLESITDGFVAYDGDWRFTYVNAQAERLLGRPREQLIGAVLWEAFPRAVGSITDREYRRAVGDNVAVSFESLYMPQEMWVDVHAYPSADGLLVYFRDITERKQAEKELLRTREYLRHLLASTPAVIYNCKVEQNWRAVFVSENVESQFGYAPQDFTSDELFWESCLHPDDLPSVLQELRGVLSRQDSHVFAYRLLCGDGAYRWIRDEVRIVRDADGKAVDTIGCWTDITEGKRIEDELQRARQASELRAAELEAVVNSMVDGVSLLDAQGNIVWMNSAGREILDYQKEDYERRESWENQFLRYSLDGERLRGRDIPVVRALQGETVRDARYRVVTPSGRECTISIGTSPVRNACGSIIGATSVFRDISEIMELERLKEEVYRRDHQIADTLQRALMAEVDHDLPGYRIVGDCKPALREAEVGGDFYDVFPLGDDRLGLVIGDVSGKGLQAAVHTAMVKNVLRAYAYEDPDPGQVLERLNRVLCAYTPDDLFVTLFYGVLHIDDGTLLYGNAGHDQPLLYESALGIATTLDITGRTAGVDNRSRYFRRDYRLSPGDILLVYTDGVLEARGPRSSFGMEQLISMLVSGCDEGADALLAAVFNAARVGGEQELRDDVAALIVEARKGTCSASQHD